MADSLDLISLDDLLKARSRHLEEEQRREQTALAALLWAHAKGVGQIRALKNAQPDACQ